MKAITSFEYVRLGLVGHLRAAVDAWLQERAVQNATVAKPVNDVPARNNTSHLSAAELYEIGQGRSGAISETGDVLSGLVLKWPSPSGKQH